MQRSFDGEKLKGLIISKNDFLKLASTQSAEDLKPIYIQLVRNKTINISRKIKSIEHAQSTEWSDNYYIMLIFF